MRSGKGCCDNDGHDEVSCLKFVGVFQFAIAITLIAPVA